MKKAAAACKASIVDAVASASRGQVCRFAALPLAPAEMRMPLGASWPAARVSSKAGSLSRKEARADSPEGPVVTHPANMNSHALCSNAWAEQAEMVGQGIGRTLAVCLELSG
eukprot:1161081-Pelagomonas_calceolata.AAC.6